MSDEINKRLYDHTSIEKKWQEKWEKDSVYHTKDSFEKPKYYVLDMFPYPSGTGLHVGHPRGYIASDVFARYKRMQGFNVLHPMGFDSFGLPAEQHAIKTGNHPGPYTEELVAHYKQQLSNIGFSYDWSREVMTHKPEYYKWTQWIFLQLYNSWYNPQTNKTESTESCIAKIKKEDPAWESYSEKEKQDMLMKYRIAYEGYAEVNWCPELGTVLANDEVITAPDGTMVSERGEYPVYRKSMRQWFMRISAYADRLLSGLDTIDWPHSIKEIQRNWIGKSEGSEIDFAIEGVDKKIKIFTTRADTLFGVTYVVLAPEHALVEEFAPAIKNWAEVQAYIAKVKATSEDDRINDKNEKTGIVLEGLYAINPANNERVPVWIANYVLASYGTGAVMAVPAHDERDFEFAKKYELPKKTVIAEKVGDLHSDQNIRHEVKAIIVKEGKLLAVTNDVEYGLPGGGIEEGETPEQALVREIEEELGYINVKITQSLGEVYRYYFSKRENQNKVRHLYGFVVEIVDEVKVPIQPNTVYPNDPDKPVLLNFEDAIKKIEQGGGAYNSILIKRFLNSKFDGFYNDGIIVNSNDFNGLTSEEARKKITEFVGGRFVTKYKMRDAIFARQRYWGEPIPLRHTNDGIIAPLSESELPLTLPDLQDFAPAGDGNSALSKSKEWMEKGYETNTMPGWAGSSWYFLRYMDPRNSEAFASVGAVKYWGQVDMYVGGAEHATGHLLYSRFWNMALHDLAYVPFAEPFASLRNQGMIAGPDGRKMSKRWGNVINPDDVVAQLGADTLRVYESFMGPFEAHLPWSVDGIAGSRRFIERVYRLFENGKVGGETNTSLEKTLHKTVKKVTEDIQSFSFNTAVSAMMILLNEIEKSESIAEADMKTFLRLLAPFAPHITEELWHKLGERNSIHLSEWPKYDEGKIIDDEVTVGIQINGKVRDEITLSKDLSKEEIERLAFSREKVQKYLEGKKIKNIVIVPGKIINIVVY